MSAVVSTDYVGQSVLKSSAVSTVDSVISVLKLLSEDSQKKVLNFTIELLEDDVGEDNPFKPKSEKELFERIDHSLAQADAGELTDADEAYDEVMAELGL